MDRVGELVGETAAASNEQVQGIDQVNKAVLDMDKVTRLTAVNAEESASEEMNTQAEQMTGMVDELVAVAGGAGKKYVGSAVSSSTKAVVDSRCRIQVLDNLAQDTASFNEILKYTHFLLCREVFFCQKIFFPKTGIFQDPQFMIGQQFYLPNIF